MATTARNVNLLTEKLSELFKDYKLSTVEMATYKHLLRDFAKNNEIYINNITDEIDERVELKPN